MRHVNNFLALGPKVGVLGRGPKASVERAYARAFFLSFTEDKPQLRTHGTTGLDSTPMWAP